MYLYRWKLYPYSQPNRYPGDWHRTQGHFVQHTVGRWSCGRSHSVGYRMLTATQVWISGDCRHEKLNLKLNCPSKAEDSVCSFYFFEPRLELACGARNQCSLIATCTALYLRCQEKISWISAKVLKNFLNYSQNVEISSKIFAKISKNFWQNISKFLR